ncbi:MAG: hypothetical protein ACR2HV_10685 [Acidimicrobiales bacterium]
MTSRTAALRRTTATRRGAALIVVAVALAGCGTKERMLAMQNVKPPAPGTPNAPAEVSGIYRSLHSAVLQLRGDGTITTIVPDGGGATNGRFTLQAGRLELQTSGCGEVPGSYDVNVTGPQKPGKAALVITAVADPCAERLRDLTRDPWVYADS